MCTDTRKCVLIETGCILANIPLYENTFSDVSWNIHRILHKHIHAQTYQSLKLQHIHAQTYGRGRLKVDGCVRHTLMKVCCCREMCFFQDTVCLLSTHSLACWYTHWCTGIANPFIEFRSISFIETRRTHSSPLVRTYDSCFPLECGPQDALRCRRSRNVVSFLQILAWELGIRHGWLRVTLMLHVMYQSQPSYAYACYV